MGVKNQAADARWGLVCQTAPWPGCGVLRGAAARRDPATASGGDPPGSSAAPDAGKQGDGGCTASAGSAAAAPFAAAAGGGPSTEGWADSLFLQLLWNAILASNCRGTAGRSVPGLLMSVRLHRMLACRSRARALTTAVVFACDPQCTLT